MLNHEEGGENCLLHSVAASEGFLSATHPRHRRERSSALDRDTFVTRFGGIYEHSPWVAEAAHALEPGLAHDSATGLANALARALRSANADQRMAVLRAHPDLAGKLAAAKRLTAESTHEKATADLDTLTNEERTSFQRLNTAYVGKHGSPFIIAMRDNTKACILQAFHDRLEKTAPQNSSQPALRSSASQNCG